MTSVYQAGFNFIVLYYLSNCFSTGPQYSPGCILHGDGAMLVKLPELVRKITMGVSNSNVGSPKNKSDYSTYTGSSSRQQSARGDRFLNENNKQLNPKTISLG